MSKDPADGLNRFVRDAVGSEAADNLALSMGGGKIAPGVDSDESPARNELPWIELPRPGRMISEFARDLGKYAAGEEIFLKDGNVVTVDDRRGIIEVMPADVFRTWIESFCTPIKKRQKPNGEILELSTSMPRDMAGATLAAPAFRESLRSLVKVNPVPLPVLRKDGRIELAKPGYDAESRIFTLQPEGIAIRDLELSEARYILDDLLKEFPFAAVDENGNSRSKAVQIAAMLSLFASGLFAPNTPRLSTIWIANSQRSGKSLLARIVINAVCGFAETKGLPGNSEEIRKVLDTAAIAAAPYVFFDDISSFLNSDALNTFMTASVWSGRLLNSQKSFTCEKVTTLFLTGNYLKMTPDLAGRSLLCNLQLDDADFQGRKISRILDEQTLTSPQMRSDILSALWGLVRSWDNAGRPKLERGMAGFEAYSTVIGGIVRHSGYGDPTCKPVDIEVGGDQRSNDMHAFLSEAWKRFKEPAEGLKYDASFREIVDLCARTNLFNEVLIGRTYEDEHKDECLELTPKARSAFGKILQSFCGKRFVIANGAILRFSTHGQHRSRSYPIEIVSMPKNSIQGPS